MLARRAMTRSTIAFGLLMAGCSGSTSGSGAQPGPAIIIGGWTQREQTQTSSDYSATRERHLDLRSDGTARLYVKAESRSGSTLVTQEWACDGTFFDNESRLTLTMTCQYPSFVPTPACTRKSTSLTGRAERQGEQLRISFEPMPDAGAGFFDLADTLRGETVVFRSNNAPTWKDVCPS